MRFALATSARCPQDAGRAVAKSDRRRQLRGHELEAGEKLVTRDVNRTLKCVQCGGPLELHTVPMTGQAIEVCRRCGTSHPIVRFRPEEEKPPPTS